jgi:hypothetical protein
MRLSEISTERAADILCELTPYVSNIASDDELLGELRRAIDSKKVINKAEWIVLGVDKINKLVPIILKKRKNDVFGIIGVLNDKTVDEIAKQNFLATMRQIKEIIKDKELLDFFKSCAGSEGNE